MRDVVMTVLALAIVACRIFLLLPDLDADMQVLTSPLVSPLCSPLYFPVMGKTMEGESRRTASAMARGAD